MATKRITVSLPVAVAARVERAAARRGSVSAWVAESVTRTLDEEELRDRFLAFCVAVRETAAEETRAKASFNRVTRPKKAQRGNKPA